MALISVLNFISALADKSISAEDNSPEAVIFTGSVKFLFIKVPAINLAIDIG